MSTTEMRPVKSFVFLVFVVVGSILEINAIVQAQDDSNEPTEETSNSGNSWLKKAKDGADALSRKATELSDDAKEVAEETIGQSRKNRFNKRVILVGQYSSLDLLIPGKYGASVAVASSEDQSFEFDFMRGSLAVPGLIADLGKMTDLRASLSGRSYFGNNSFNLLYGITYFDFSVKVGDKLLSRISQDRLQSWEVFGVNALGLQFGLGNRWTFDQGFLFGVDWFTWSQPMFIVKRKIRPLSEISDESDRRDVDKAVRFISYFPRFSFLKLQLGYTF